MKIVYHHRTQGTGAEGVHIAYVIRGLRERGHQVTVVSPTGKDPDQTAGENPFGRKQGLKGRALGALSQRLPQWAFEALEVLYNVPAYLKLRQSESTPQLVYERHAFFMAAGALYARRRGAPYFIEVNEVSGDERVRKQVFAEPARRFERFVFDRADAILVVSDHLKDRIVALGVPGHKVHVVPNGVDAERFSPVVDGTIVRQRLGLGDRVVIGFVGWFVGWHNLELLVDAVADISEGRNVALMLVGDGDLKAQLVALAERRGIADRLVLPGAVAHSEIPQHIAAMDICVIPGSNAYRSPLKMFEYMATEKAVVAPDLAPIRRVITSGEHGLLFAPDSRGELASALGQLCDDPSERERLGKAARAKILAQHTWSQVAGQVLQTYETTVQRAKSR
ncbi:MAG: hypothetical protein RJA70_1733 [Pseudomonadota bacterium]|jgi:glycosyltransferase involved in cell wall biosynthesis